MNDDTFEVKTAVRLTPMNLGFIVAVLLFLGSIVTGAIFAVLNSNGIISYATNENNARLKSLLFELDSLSILVNQQDLYLNSIQQIVTGDYDTSLPRVAERINQSPQEVINRKPVEADSILRSQLENSMTVLSAFDDIHSSAYTHLLTLPLVTGIVGQPFEPALGHNGVDLLVKKSTQVFAIDEGEVLFSDWTQNSGYVVIIAHSNNLYSVYAHNLVNLKITGEKVSRGDIIALSGTSSGKSVQEKLHFEIWKEGKPVDPSHYFSQLKQ